MADFDFGQLPAAAPRMARRDFFRFGDVQLGEAVALLFEENFHELRESRMGIAEANVTRVHDGKPMVLSMGDQLAQLFRATAPHGGKTVVIARARDGTLSCHPEDAPLEGISLERSSSPVELAQRSPLRDGRQRGR